ncbi:MAG: RNA polymerase sigma factor [Planctomycetota bacterium]|jgi:RNA polymerase sigma factor (sigma-70 family)
MTPSDPDHLAATSTDLLIGLGDLSNDKVWSMFCSRYRAVIISFARRAGLSEQDAQDAAQDTLLAFADAYRKGKYNRDKGHLRTWLFSIARHKIHDIQRKNFRQPMTVEPGERTRLLNRLPDDHSMSEIWEMEWQRAIIKTCLNDIYGRVEISTIRAFELLNFNNWTVDKVASHLGMTRNAVYKAQRRVLTRLRERYKYLNDAL